MTINLSSRFLAEILASQQKVYFYSMMEVKWNYFIWWKQDHQRT